MEIELLYFDGCPGFEELLPRLQGLLADRGLTAGLRLVAVESADAAATQRFLGSPSVRVDGRDVEPGADERRDFGMKCRIYQQRDGIGRAPTDAQIAAALDR